MADDLIQKVREAVTEIVETHPLVIALTGRDQDNIVAFNADVDPDLPVYAYAVVVAVPAGGDGDTRRVRVQITAAADDEDVAQEMLGVAERILSANSFLSLAEPLDAVPVGSSRSGVDLEVTLLVTMQAPAIV